MTEDKWTDTMGKLLNIEYMVLQLLKMIVNAFPIAHV